MRFFPKFFCGALFRACGQRERFRTLSQAGIGPLVDVARRGHLRSPTARRSMPAGMESSERWNCRCLGGIFPAAGRS
jgi:hypothetical protein